MLNKGGVVQASDVRRDRAVEEVGDVDDGAGHGQGGEVEELGADRATAHLVVLKDNVSED